MNPEFWRPKGTVLQSGELWADVATNYKINYPYITFRESPSPGRMNNKTAATLPAGSLHPHVAPAPAWWSRYPDVAAPAVSFLKPQKIQPFSTEPPAPHFPITAISATMPLAQEEDDLARVPVDKCSDAGLALRCGELQVLHWYYRGPHRHPPPRSSGPPQPSQFQFEP